MYLKRTIEPLETEDVGDNVANDSTSDVSTNDTDSEEGIQTGRNI